MVYGLGFRVELKVHGLGFRFFLGLGFKVQGSRLRVETVRLGLIVKLSQGAGGCLF